MSTIKPRERQSTAAGLAPRGSSEDERKERAIAFIRQSAAKQVESIQAIMDGATLAGEQVQDKRLELLERGPEVTGLGILWEFALTFVLESNLVGKSLRFLTRKILTPRIQTHITAKNYTLRTFALRTKPSDVRIIPHMLTAQKLANELRNLNNVLRFLDIVGSDNGPMDYADPMIKAIRAAASRSESAPIQREPSDTPGVMILDLAQAYASSQRLSIQIEHSLFEVWVRTGLMSVDEVYESMTWESMMMDGQPISLAEIKDQYKRYFELLIWTLLLYERPLTGKHVTTPRQSFTLVGYVQPSLISYWIKRFIDPQTGQPFSETPTLARPDGRPDLGMAIPALGNYMWRIAEQAARNKIALVSAGPLVPRASLLKHI